MKLYYTIDGTLTAVKRAIENIIVKRYQFKYVEVFSGLTPICWATSLRRILNFIVYRMQDSSLENIKTHLTGVEQG